MANKKMRKLALLTKIETVYGTDPTPTGAVNAMVVANAEVTPLDGDVAERQLVQGFFGNQGSVQASFMGKLKFSTELSGSGTAGTAPKWGVLARGCAMSETITAGVSVTYAPISDLLESVTMYCNIDGINHIITGARGEMKPKLSAKGIPMIDWEFTGLFTPLTDTVLPACTYTGWAKPVAVNKANTTATLHGIAIAMQEFNMGLNNQVVKRDLVNVDLVDITDRKSAGSIVFENNSIATKDWVGTAKATTLGTLDIVHGTVAGNIVEFLATSTCEVSKPTYSNSDGVQMMNLQLRFIPSTAGNDEHTIIVR